MATYKKKLIEVALPLAEINDASAYDKMPGIGPHPKGIHQWWARLPLPAARAILFASVVDDPSEHQDRFPTEYDQDAERERLFDVIRQMLGKKVHENHAAISAARAEMERACGGHLPSFVDPFSGGGSIPLEASRLGFDAVAQDLNPVAVMLNRCNLEIVPRFASTAPVNSETRNVIGWERRLGGGWGLFEDIRHYARVLQVEVSEKRGNLYHPVDLPKEVGGGKAPVVAWIWARTVPSPDPVAKGAHVPLVRSFVLSTKKGAQAWVEPIIDKAAGTIDFKIGTTGNAPKKGTIARTGGTCLLTGSPITFDHIRKCGQAGQIRTRLLAVACEAKRGKIFLSPTDTFERLAHVPMPDDYPESDLPEQALGFRIQKYGFKHHWQMYTPRQLGSLVALSDGIREIATRIEADALQVGFERGDAKDYAKAITTFLALALDRCADFNNSFCRWSSSNQKVMNLFGRQVIPMLWDFAEANMLGSAVGAWLTCADYVADCVQVIGASKLKPGKALQMDAAVTVDRPQPTLVSTDPPYYDNIGYSALSDFFYIWLRRTVGQFHPDICRTLLTPKAPELTAAPEKFDGDKLKAKEHFEGGFRKAFEATKDNVGSHFPMTVYYAFKQEDEDEGDDEDARNAGITLTTGWETFLEALVSSGYQITATWPVSASQKWRMRSMGANALASYIVLACRPRDKDAPSVPRGEFLGMLKKELPPALRHLQQGNIAPVDMAQASIGPGMAIFSRFSKVLESDDSPMGVKTALQLIINALDEFLAEQEGEYDADTRFAITWFESYGLDNGPYGVAETLATARAVSVQGVAEAGILEAKGGVVRLLRRSEMPDNWDPRTDKRLTVWECVQHLIRAIDADGDEAGARLLKLMGSDADPVRDLAYRLYGVCERNKWAEEALAYNNLVVVWPDLVRMAASAVEEGPAQGFLI